MSKRIIHGVEVNVRTKPLASDSYKKYPCETPGCTDKVEGHCGQENWVSAWKIRKASIKEFGAVLCLGCRMERREDARDPAEVEADRRYWEGRNKQLETLTLDDLINGRTDGGAKGAKR
jgi:hypothetical protein